MVKFDCDPGYILSGERRRWCYDTGDWNWPENGNAQCTRKLKKKNLSFLAHRSSSPPTFLLIFVLLYFLRVGLVSLSLCLSLS